MRNAIAKAALADTRGLAKAIAIIRALLDQGVPSEVAAGLNAALEALSQLRDDVGGEAPGGALGGLLSWIPTALP